MLDLLKRLLAHRYLAAVLAIGAILVMLPALHMGLVLDDLPQRAVALRPDQLPPQMHETGNPASSGSLSTVLGDFFFHRSPEDVALMKNYGALHEHHQWRSAMSRSALVLSALFLALSLFADEAGASTFAFILAFALVLEPGSLRSRALTVLPSYKAYHHQTVPRSVRALVPGCTSFDVRRTDDKTFVVQSERPDMFSSDEVGRMHAAYLFRTLNLAVGGTKPAKGHCAVLPGLRVEVQEVSEDGFPTRVAFRFDNSLDSPDIRWLCWDWRTFSDKPFEIPAIGQRVTLLGPSRLLQ